MAISQYKPTTPGRRGMTSRDFDAITTKKPLKSLTVTKRRTNGRNNQGRITTRHRGGGARRFYRIIYPSPFFHHAYGTYELEQTHQVCDQPYFL